MDMRKQLITFTEMEKWTRRIILLVICLSVILLVVLRLLSTRPGGLGNSKI